MDILQYYREFVIVILILRSACCFDYEDDDDSPLPSRCPNIKNRLKNGRVKIRSRGRVAKFVCNARFDLVGKRVATCVRGQWNSPLPVCVVGGCTKLPELSNGKVTDLYQGAVRVYDCLPGYTLEGTNTLYCDGRRWNGPPPSCRVSAMNPKTSCDFEDPDLCDWTQDPTHDFDWKRNQFGTPSGHVGTGPSFDHTFGIGKGGFYLYEEASSPRKENDTSRVFSPVFPSSYSGGCFVFWYHMYGATTGGLRVYIKPESHLFGELSPSWSKFKDQGNQWIRGNISVPALGENFQIIIEGIRGSSYVGDTAIDDVSISSTDCDSIDSNNSTESVQESKTDSCRGRCREEEDPGSCACTDTCQLNGTCCSDYIICTQGSDIPDSENTDEYLTPESQTTVSEHLTTLPPQQVTTSSATLPQVSTTMAQTSSPTAAVTTASDGERETTTANTSELATPKPTMEITTLKTTTTPKTTTKVTTPKPTTKVTTQKPTPRLTTLILTTKLTTPTTKLTTTKPTTISTLATSTLNVTSPKPPPILTEAWTKVTTRKRVTRTTTAKPTTTKTTTTATPPTTTPPTTTPPPTTPPPPTPPPTTPSTTTQSSTLVTSPLAITRTHPYNLRPRTSTSMSGLTSLKTSPTQAPSSAIANPITTSTTPSKLRPSSVLTSAATESTTKSGSLTSKTALSSTITSSVVTTISTVQTKEALIPQPTTTATQSTQRSTQTTTSTTTAKLTTTRRPTTAIHRFSYRTLATRRQPTMPTTSMEPETTKRPTSPTPQRVTYSRITPSTNPLTSRKPEMETSVVEMKVHPSKAASTAETKHSSTATSVSVSVVLLACLACVIGYVIHKRRSVKQSKLFDDSEMRFLPDNEVIEYSDPAALDGLLVN